MNVKVNTKEKFHVITIQGPVLSANMTAQLDETLLGYAASSIKNVVLSLKDIQKIDEAAAIRLAEIQQKFYETNCSFVICNLAPDVENFLDEKELLEVMNVTPTESEAWDIVQMEEIERELTQNDN